MWLKGRMPLQPFFLTLKMYFQLHFRGAFVQKEIGLDSQRGFCPYLKTSVSFLTWVPVDFRK